MSARSLTAHLRNRLAVTTVATVAAFAMLGAGCGLQDSVEQAVEEGAEAAQEAAEEAAREAAEEVAEEVADGAVDAAGDAVADAVDAVDGADAHPFDQRLRDEADSFNEASTIDGGLVAVAIECESQLGGSLMHVGMQGIAPGLYESEITPSSGSMDVNVVEAGTGLAIRQSRYEEPSYTVTYPGIDGGISVTVDGCPAG